jgi:hypothetical protein
VKAVERAGKIRGGKAKAEKVGTWIIPEEGSQDVTEGGAQGRAEAKVEGISEERKQRSEQKWASEIIGRRPGEPKTQTNKSINGGPQIEGRAEGRAEMGVEVRADAQAEVKARN